MGFDGRKYRRVAVLMGGPSEERDVSLRSGAAVADGLRLAGYDVAEVDVKGHSVELPDGVEAVFIALHGEFGEDGGVQAVLDEMGIAYTGSGAESSRRAMDKILTKQAFVKNGVPTPEYEVIRRGDSRLLDLPVVVKPACQGSSIGVHLVFSESDWQESLDDAFGHGEELLVEKFVAGRELTVGVVGGQALPVIEIVVADGWYGYDAKYTTGRTEYLVPADIGEGLTRKAQSLALQAFAALGCGGFGRVDFILDDVGGLWTLELNSIPGFTQTSLLPKAAACAGIDFAELCDRIMQSAVCGGAQQAP